MSLIAWSIVVVTIMALGLLLGALFGKSAASEDSDIDRQDELEGMPQRARRSGAV